ncbi:hypothetical protein [Halomonas sp. MES3-P3E]|uniref:hypothetical protein n=1 Tax=Halomonas sp. MES3-P3E TaxID=2058321 RepID=UPI0018E3C54F|nr:hypothetical protein [Halomonas sp. MES3-P3E]
MDQLTFSEAEYQNKKRKARREPFLDRMSKLIPWSQLEKKVVRYYPKDESGRPPNLLSAMLCGGSIVDTTIIFAPSSTKNKKGEREPEMHQAKKGGPSTSA